MNLSMLKALVVTSVVTASFGLGTTAAYAADNRDYSNLEQCVSVNHSTGNISQTVTVINKCHHAISFAVDREAANSSCYYLASQATQKVKWNMRDAYHGTYACSGGNAH